MIWNEHIDHGYPSFSDRLILNIKWIESMVLVNFKYVTNEVVEICAKSMVV